MSREVYPMENRNEGWLGEPIMVKCSTCGIEFDILKAKDCRHNTNGMGTKQCPYGHCVCHLPLRRFRWATKDEQRQGFAFVLKSAFPCSSIAKKEKMNRKPCPYGTKIEYMDEVCKVTVCNGECHPNYGKGSSVKEN